MDRATAFGSLCLTMTTTMADRPFSVGDKVYVHVSSKKTWKSHFTSDFETLIIEVSRNNGNFKYGVGHTRDTCCWWYDHDDLTLISKATRASELRVLEIVLIE